MSGKNMTVAVGERLPLDVPEDSDGTPMGIPVFLNPWPLRMVLPADVSQAHEDALMQSQPDGKISRLICMQAHQRLLTPNADPEAKGYLPLMQCSIYLRDQSGPMHKPLHWVGSVDVLGLGEPQSGMMFTVLHQLADQPRKGPPAQLMVTGRGGRLLLVANAAMHNEAARVWAFALHLAMSARGLHPDDFAEMLMVAEADLLPLVQRQGCMRALMPVAICGQRKTVRGGQLQAWLLKHGWLHPKQVACDDADGGAA
jgi:hypothetical protein